MEIPLAVLFLGVVVGLTYGILSVGLVLIYRANRIINFAHGEVGAFGAAVFGLWVVAYGLPYWLMFPVVLAVSAGVSMLIETVAIRRLRKAPSVMSLVATLGAAAFLLLLSYAVNQQIRRGADFPQPPGVPEFTVGGDLLVTPAYSAMFFVTPLLVLAITAFLRYTRYGIAMRAAADNRDAAVMAGISATRMSSIAWALAGVVSAYTAILQFPQKGFVTTGASLGPGLLVRALVVSVVARMTSLPLALGVGIGIGVLEQVVLWNVPSQGFVEVPLFVILLVTLLLQSRQGGREAETGSWAAVQSWEPLPERLQALWTVRNLGRIAAGATLLALLALALTTNRAAYVFTLLLGYTLVGLSVYVVTGLGGQLSLGQFALAGIGAVASYHLIRYGASFVVGLLGAALAGALVSVVIGVPAIRIRGLMLAVTTLSFAVLAEAWLFQQPWMIGGGVDPQRPAFGASPVETAKQYYLVAVPIFVVGAWLAWNVTRSGIGRSLRALRDNEDGARAFTVHATKLKLQSFVLAGFLAGLGGALYAHGVARLTTTTFNAGASITTVAMSVIGGISLLAGPFIGALYLIAMPAFVPLDAAGAAASTLGWLLLILYFPGGLAQMVKPLRDRLVDMLARRAGVDPEAVRREGTAEEEQPRPRLELSRASPRRVPFPETLLTVSGVSKRFGGITAVDGVDLEVGRSETLGIIGPNGAGKTTLFEIIGGFTKPDTGSVRFDYTDVTGLPPELRAELGLLRSFQDARLFATMTVLETVSLAHERAVPTRFFPSLLGLPSASRAERSRDARARDLIAAMGLDDYRNKRVNELSTGTRRITEMACLIALEPKLLLLDEPSSGIAQRETEALGELLVRLKDLLDTTFVIIEHDMPLIMGISDRIVAMESGRVLAEGTPDEVRNDEAVVTSYLGGDVRAIERSGAATTQPAPIP